MTSYEGSSEGGMHGEPLCIFLKTVLLESKVMKKW